MVALFVTLVIAGKLFEIAEFLSVQARIWGKWFVFPDGWHGIASLDLIVLPFLLQLGSCQVDLPVELRVMPSTVICGQ